ncbi:type III effector [Vibrio ponticus]|uniref:Type III effector n=1 Tax=Vibrio ponticus TaxID=265668 RepID=A0ABX3F688_9VIBR|nr:HopJ type III effector protein [Vibrio ponticus]OLQ84284.1 type III effector [Vibrio ponticus]
MELKSFLTQLESSPTTIEFSESIAVIDANYTFTPAAFSNGTMRNPAGENNGSCKILAFGQVHKLSEEHTLAMFGDFYRKDVLGNPDGNDHQNIRNFIAHGWNGIKFEGQALEAIVTEAQAS